MCKFNPKNDGRRIDPCIRKFPRKKRFYVKDKQGYYFIPEVKQSEGISHPKAKAMGIRNAREI